LTVSDGVGLLIGERRAIRRLARSRSTLAIGLVLVLSASLARNYDGIALPAEWHALTHGVVVSSANALALFTLFYLLTKWRGGRAPRYWRGYLAFLGVFWMLAPMGWLYGVPYERFLRPVDALAANLWTLALVSVWRVALATRVLSVLFRVGPVRSFFAVMLVGDVLFFGAAVLAPAPVIDFMGGLQLTEEEQLLANVTFAAQFWTFLTFPVWLIGALGSLPSWRGRWTLRLTGRGAGATRPLLVLAAVSALAWLLPHALVTGLPQMRRARADELLRTGRVREALEYLSRFDREDLPPIWDPAPRLGYGEESPDDGAIRIALEGTEVAPWVRAMYLEKSWRLLMQDVHGWRHEPDPAVFREHWERDAEWLLERMTPELAAGLCYHGRHDERLAPDLAEWILETFGPWEQPSD
jgi:hypothetical protein